ncbi:unnamed protein product, partial [Phaeothamnion confervicola]
DSRGRRYLHSSGLHAMTVDVPWSTLRPNPRTAREDAVKAANPAPHGDGANPLSANDTVAKYLWRIEDVGRRAAFGCILGGVTGITFGAMDAHRVIRNDATAKFSTAGLKATEALRQCAMSGKKIVWGAFFTGYMVFKHSAMVYRQEDDFFNVLIAGPAAIAPFLPFPAVRARLPYAMLLVAMDTINSHVL